MHLSDSSPDPFYQQIKDALRDDIVSGRLKPGALVPDERSMALALKVSRKTTRRALLELTEEGLLRRFRGRGTFVRETVVPEQFQRNDCICIACQTSPFDSSSQYYSNIMQGVYQAAAEMNLFVVFERVVTPYDQFIANVRRHRSAKGLILIGVGSDSASVEPLKRLEMPIVMIDCHQGEKQYFDLVSHESEAAVYSAVRYLQQLGHTDIAFMQAEQLSSITQGRYDGYVRALREQNQTVRRELVYKVPHITEAAYAATARILRSDLVPTAIVCVGDEHAVGALTAVTDFGWRVPRDMSLVGFGDIAVFTSPRLSTVRVPKQQMGYMAMRLLEMRQARPTAPVQRVMLPVEWILRGSCDAPRSGGTTKISERIDHGW
jgi:DNA-binding LacI/PurR family transcriptional regulator